jgi:hypothetical protein
VSAWSTTLLAAVAGIPLGWCTLCHFITRQRRQAFIWALAGIPLHLSIGAVDLALGRVWSAAFYAGLAGLHSYIAWRNRPRRNRFAEKALGVVRNLGHRLVVVPAGGRS